MPHIGWIMTVDGETGGLGDWETGGLGAQSPRRVPPSPTSPSLLPAAAGGPARDGLLRSPGQGESVGGDVLRDRGARSDVGAVSDGDGRHELAVAADEGAAA